MNHDVKSNFDVENFAIKWIMRYERLKYGSALLDNLSKDPKLKYGEGFRRRNILNMRGYTNMLSFQEVV